MLVLAIISKKSERLLALLLQKIAGARRADIFVVLFVVRTIALTVQHAKIDVHNHRFFTNLLASDHEVVLLHSKPFSQLFFALDGLFDNISESLLSFPGILVLATL
jgi:hypothetical protein